MLPHHFASLAAVILLFSACRHPNSEAGATLRTIDAAEGGVPSSWTCTLVADKSGNFAGATLRFELGADFAKLSVASATTNVSGACERTITGAQGDEALPLYCPTSGVPGVALVLVRDRPDSPYTASALKSTVSQAEFACVADGFSQAQTPAPTQTPHTAPVPQPANPLVYEDVAKIIEKHCATCHKSTAPRLRNKGEVFKAYNDMIDVINTNDMPPDDDGSFKTSADGVKLLQWL